MGSNIAARKERHADRWRDSRRSWTTVALLGVIIAALLLTLVWLVTQGPGRSLVSPAGSTVAEFSGDDEQATSMFSVREGWSIHWENSGDEFSFAINGDRDFGTVIEQEEPGSGVTSPVGEGSYRLEIQASGPWRIRIVQGE